ncbi:MAG: DUF669 domain-containing protein [Pirellulaceae bacterium]|nr:DUF669 domain-containing protein [Pirellulaceae bacterium]
MASLKFNAAEVEPSSPLDPIPAGKYAAVITESEMKPTKSGGGSYLQLTLEVIEGEYKGRMLWVRLNLENPNAVAVQIARKELSAICRAVGVMQPKDSQDLHHLPLIVDVRCKKRSDCDELSNVVKAYRTYGTPVATPPVVAGGPSPWKRS